MSGPPAISSTFPPVSCLYNLQNHDQSTRSWKPPNYSRPWPSLYLESLQTFVVFTALLALRVRGIYILISELHSKFSSADASQASFCIFWTASFWDSLSLCILPLLSLTMASSHGLYLPATHSQHWLLEAPSLRKKKRETQWLKDHGIQWSCINPHGVRTNHLKEWQDPQTCQFSEHLWANHACGNGG